MKKARRIIYGFTVAGLLALLALFPFSALSAEQVPAALEEAKAAIDQARMAGAEKSAPDDLAQARSWLAQAEKQQASSQSILSRTMKLVKSNEAAVREVMYLASMAKVKAQTAEAKARRIAAAAELKDALKDLADFQSSLEIMKKKQAEADVAKTVQARVEAERKVLEKSKQNAAALEAQKKKELEEAKIKTAELDALKQSELAQAKLDGERQELQKQKEALKTNAREEQMAADRKKMVDLEQKMAALEKEKAMQADAAKIAQATVKSTDKEIVITLLTINVLTPKNELSSGGKAILDQVGTFLKKHAAGATIAVRGYTDSAGKADANRTLSRKRAVEVKEYLVLNQNIPAANVTEQGLGPADPVASNATVAGRALNRRVEIIVPLAR
jgi:outer membrane protein OmpA-like peptidoglycan-associated protein